MKDKDGIIILIVIFIFVGFSWDSLKQEVRVNNANKTRTNAWENVFGNSSVGGDAVSEKDQVGQIKEIERKTKELEKKIAEAEAQRMRSPYYGKVLLSYIAYLNDPDPSREYLTLYTNLNKGEKIDITGWFLKSDRSGNSATIGRASVMPYPYVAGGDNVVLHQGDRVYLVKGFSPINISFRTNLCTGYFEENRTFYPSLSMQCPLARDEELPKFSNLLDREDECIEIIERIPRCTTIGNEFIRDLPDTVTSSCKTYLRTQINYNACIANHRSDIDFPGQEWYVYLNRFGPLWRSQRETIKLYDQLGLVVSTLKYGF